MVIKWLNLEFVTGSWSNYSGLFWDPDLERCTDVDYQTLKGCTNQRFNNKNTLRIVSDDKNEEL